MAKIVDYRNIALDDLVIGKAQVRTDAPGREVEDLAKSIQAQGLLQPIVICRAQEEGKWEILTGQRRFFAHKILSRPTIAAVVLDERVDAERAKAISITENLMRRNLSSKELTDGITYLYKHYGNVNAVADVTGLPRRRVEEHVKYPRLVPELKEIVDKQEADVNTALKAQDAARGDDGKVDVEIAKALTGEMTTLSGVQRKKFIEEYQKDPTLPIDDAMERAKSGSRISQVVVTVTERTKKALRQFAAEERVNQDEAAVALIEDSLNRRGMLDADG